MQITDQIFCSEQSMGFSLGHMDIFGVFEIEMLVQWGVFEIHTRPNFIGEKISLSNGINYLAGLFISDELVKDDFKFLPGSTIYYYLEGFSDSEEEWGDDKQSFKRLLQNFIEITSKSIDGCYLINKEWFDWDSRKIRQPEYSIYDFYFIIVWVDKNIPSKVCISEWFAD